MGAIRATREPIGALLAKDGTAVEISAASLQEIRVTTGQLGIEWVEPQPDRSERVAVATDSMRLRHCCAAYEN